MCAQCSRWCIRLGLHRLEASLSNTQHPMPSSRHFSRSRPTVSSASPQSNDPTPGPPPSIAQSTPGPSTTPQPAYPDYMNENTTPGWDAAVAMASMLDNIPTLPLVLAGPLSQVLDVISGMIDAVKAMREGKDGCEHLIFRVLRFLQSLVDESRGSSMPIVEGTPTAARLFALKRCVSPCPCPFYMLIISLSVIGT
jgi:hypothetical protein